MSQPADKSQAVAVQILAALSPSGSWTVLTLELLGDASTLAKRWNGRVGAWVLSRPEALSADLSELAAHGCDVVCHLEHDRLASWSSEAVAAALAQAVPAGCRVILLPADARGEEVAALLAERLETAWIPDALALAVTRSAALEVTAVQPGGKLSRVFRPGGERPAVVTMRAGVPEARREEKPRPLEVQKIPVDLADVPRLTGIERFLAADPRTLDISLAQRVVSAGRGSGGPEGVQLVACLAEVLRASLGASRLVVDLGWAPPERQVGQTGKTVRPDLYVACGISGASHHLAGMRDSKHIIAINPDASAPIHEVAHMSLHGDLHVLIPAIQATALRRSSSKGPATR
jgi:electron transfer flavoprotein alpha subunit